MITKWFFQHQFSSAPLCLVRAAAANFNYAHLGCCNTNQIVTFAYLDIDFYKHAGWANKTAETTPYKPYPNISGPLYFYENYGDWKDPKKATKIDWHTQTYNQSVNYQTGWFQSGILKAKYITDESTQTPTRFYADRPINHARYNINEDSGKGNKMWLHSIYNSSYDPPSTDKELIIEGLPLYMMLYGWLSYIQALKKDQNFFQTYIIVIECPAFRVFTEAGATKQIVPIDPDFINGKGPYGEVITQYSYEHWYPNLYNQLSVLNEFVTAGPYIPKYQRTTNSTWELHYFYRFFLSGEELFYQDKTFKTQKTKTPSLSPVTTLVEYKSRTRGNKEKHPCFTPGTLEEGYLVKDLLKEFSKTQSLEKLYLQAQLLQNQKEQEPKQSRNIWTPQTTFQPKSKKQTKKVHRRRKKKRKQSSSSSETTDTSSESSEDNY